MQKTVGRKKRRVGRIYRNRVKAGKLKTEHRKLLRMQRARGRR